jgi:hypothetical protein
MLFTQFGQLYDRLCTYVCVFGALQSIAGATIEELGNSLRNVVEFFREKNLTLKYVLERKVVGLINMYSEKWSTQMFGNI